MTGCHGIKLHLILLPSNEYVLTYKNADLLNARGNFERHSCSHRNYFVCLGQLKEFVGFQESVIAVTTNIESI